MVIETRIVFELGDILTIRIVCKKCGREAVQSFESTPRDVPNRCVWCGMEWRNTDDDVKTVNSLLFAVSQLSRIRPCNIEVKLELDKDALNPPD